MAVTSPRVGTTAFAETGQRNMSAARTTLGLVARPGKLSEMVGKSKSFFMTVASYVGYAILAGEPTHRGAGGLMTDHKDAGQRDKPFGAIDSNTVFGGVTQLAATRSKVSTVASITGNLAKRNLILSIKGRNFQFNYTDYGSGYYAWPAADPNGLFDYLGTINGQRVECIPQN